jgi:hypothetical protein
MAHLKFGGTKAGATPREWLKVGRDIGYLANKWSIRNDLVAYVGPGAGGPAPACYSPTEAEIEVNVEVAFGVGITPEKIGDITLRKTQYEFPKATGAIMHEAFHARFSQWSMPKAYEDLARDEYEALMLLEESRIEYQGLRSMPNARPFLRSCAMDIVLGDTKKDAETTTQTHSLTNLVGLVFARIDAGILDEYEVEPITSQIVRELGVDVVEQLRQIARSAQLHDKHNDATDLYPLAKEWARIVRELAKERGDDQQKPEGGIGIPSPILEKIIETMSEIAQEIEANNCGDLAEQEQREDWKEQVQAKASDAKEQAENREIAKQIFSKSTGPGSARTSSKLLEKRNPTTAELVASTRIGQYLDKAKYRERDEKEVSSLLPPGRLRTKAILQNRALRSKGVMTQVEPFRKTMRKHTDDPTLNVGIMVDISGSMGGAMRPMATTAWVMSEAVNRIQGNCAMVYYGNDVFPTLKVGQRQKEVFVYSAEDGTEKFDKAFSALDGTLNLLHGNGAKLLVIVSDGQYTHDETRKCKEIVAKCKEAGVAILWLPFDRGTSAVELGGDYAEVMANVNDPLDAVEAIGRACERVLTKVSKRNA